MTCSLFESPLSGCGGPIHLLRHQSAEVFSNSFPDDLHYQPGVQCSWNVTTHPLLWLHIRVERFHLEPSENCSKDYLELDGFERQCGDLFTGSVLVRTPFLGISFASDLENEEEGFRLLVKAVGKFVRVFHRFT